MTNRSAFPLRPALLVCTLFVSQCALPTPPGPTSSPVSTRLSGVLSECAFVEGASVDQRITTFARMDEASFESMLAVSRARRWSFRLDGELKDRLLRSLSQSRFTPWPAPDIRARLDFLDERHKSLGVLWLNNTAEVLSFEGVNFSVSGSLSKHLLAIAWPSSAL